MADFIYKAARDDGSSVGGELIAASAADARQTLEAKGYLVLSLRKKGRLGAGRGNAKDFLIFNQEFMTLVKAGLPILQALELLLKRMEQPGFRSALASVIDAIRSGSAISDAMAAQPAYFPALYTSTVRAGEQSGALVDILKRHIAYQKRMLAIRRKLTTALAYPAFLVVALLAVMLLFFLYIIPNFTQMYGDQAGELPFLTTLLVNFTDMLTRYAPLIGAALAGTVIGAAFWRRTDAGKRTLDGVLLRLPLVRTLLIQYVLAQVTRTLATVLRGGIPLVQALDTTAGVIGNRVIAEKLLAVREIVIGGASLADAFDRTKLAPDMTVRMIEVGESSGDLPQMLEDVADFYEQETENRVAVLTTMIEPALMLVMGLVIAFIVVALYLPIFEMGARLK